MVVQESVIQRTVFSFIFNSLEIFISNSYLACFCLDFEGLSPNSEFLFCHRYRIFPLISANTCITPIYWTQTSAYIRSCSKSCVLHHIETDRTEIVPARLLAFPAVPKGIFFLNQDSSSMGSSLESSNAAVRWPIPRRYSLLLANAMNVATLSCLTSNAASQSSHAGPIR